MAARQETEAVPLHSTCRLNAGVAVEQDELMYSVVGVNIVINGIMGKHVAGWSKTGFWLMHD